VADDVVDTGASSERRYSTPAIAAGTALVADASQLMVGVRKDAEVSFSSDAKFTADAVVARVVARVDFGINDPTGPVKVTV
jgi:HK97 family phage major capsid protein